MAMTVDEIKDIIKESRLAGHDVKMKDVAYIIVRTVIDDRAVAYRSVFDAAESEDSVKRYEMEPGIKFLKNRLKKYISPKAQKSAASATKVQDTSDKDINSKYKDITFEENKEAMLELIDEIQEGMRNKEIDVAVGLKMQTDIRTKLQDKFEVSNKKDEHRIVVNTKFNHICEWTRKECFLQTKEYAMKQWGLIKDPALKGENKYDKDE